MFAANIIYVDNVFIAAQCWLNETEKTMSNLEVYNLMLANADWNYKDFINKAYAVGSNSRMKALEWAIYRANLMRYQAARFAAANGVAI